MKRSLVIASLLAFLVCLSVLLTFHRKCYFTTATKSYATWEQAIKEGAISAGWLPDFLPRSAYQIREKHNYEQNTIIAAFSFDQSEDVAVMFRGANVMPKSRWQTVRPSVICRRERWFPDEIIEGRFEELTQNGFKIYEIGPNPSEIGGNGKIVHWYAAVNQDARICYLWN